MKNYDCLGQRHINQQQNKSTQKLFLNKNEKSSRERKVFVFFQQDQTTITKTSHKGFDWLKHKKKHKKHNHNRIMKVWTQQNRMKKDKFIGLPPNKRYCLTPLAGHKSDRITYRRLWCSNHKLPSSWIHKAILFYF